jgi:hypothetical protein
VRVILACLLLGFAPWAARADGFDLPQPPSSVLQEPAPAAGADAGSNSDALVDYFVHWADRVAQARATQPQWSSPLVTTTGLLEQRLRFDVARQHAGNGADTTLFNGDRGVDLIVSESNELQIAGAPYVIRTSTTSNGNLHGFSDWAFLRIKQRLLSSPESDGNYVVTAWLQVQAPTGSPRLTNGAWTFLPTLALGKGWSNLDIQATIGAALPTSQTKKLDHTILTNVALQYHLFRVFWPEIEANWTYYADGSHAGLHQVYLTSGLVAGKFSLTNTLKLSLGIGYQTAVAPPYRPNPGAPGYEHAWLFTTRLNF